MSLGPVKHILFDWGDTLMIDIPGAAGPMHTWPVVKATPNAEQTLASLSSKVKCHIATNAKDSTAEDVRLALRRVRLESYITEIFCYRKVGAVKPSQLFFDYILATLNCDFSELLTVGDNLEDDVIGALRYRIQGIYYDPAGLSVPEGIPAITDLQDLLQEIDSHD